MLDVSDPAPGDNSRACHDDGDAAAGAVVDEDEIDLDVDNEAHDAKHGNQESALLDFVNHDDDDVIHESKSSAVQPSWNGQPPPPLPDDDSVHHHNYVDRDEYLLISHSPLPDSASAASSSNGNSNSNSKNSSLQQRLRQLQMKMNQARSINRKEVIHEGERLGNAEGMAIEQKRLAQEEKRMRQAEWDACTAKTRQAMPTSSSSSSSLVVDGKAAKYMTEQATDSMRKAAKKAAKSKSNRFDMDDYYNPEGQHRNYERSLRSIPTTTTTSANTSALPSSTTAHLQDDDGPKRLAAELRRRMDQGKATRKRAAGPEFESTDVSYINQRNKRYNEKIHRNFDKHTAEIRQNLERGTAS